MKEKNTQFINEIEQAIDILQKAKKVYESGSMLEADSRFKIILASIIKFDYDRNLQKSNTF